MQMHFYADLLCAVTAATHQFSNVAAAQQTDTIISTLLDACVQSECVPQEEKWNKPPLKR